MSQTDVSPETDRAPDGFAVEWVLEDLPHLHWSLDRMHFPDPMGPLTVSFERVSFNTGTDQAFAEYSLPGRLRFQAVNGYLYSTQVPVTDDPAALAEMGRQAEQRIGAAARRLREIWEDEALPDLQADVAALRAFDYASASDSDLASHLDWLVERRAHHWYLHFKIMVPAFGPVVAFEELYRSQFQPADDTEPYRLVEGLGNRTVDGGHALWRLSRLAAKSPAVREAIAHAAPEQLFERLEETPEGREFARAFREYLDEFGWRGDSWSMDDRTWVSYPKTPQDTLRAYLAQPDEASPEPVHAALARQREEAIAQARERLAGSPMQVREQFEALLKAAQLSLQVQEDHNYYIDQMLQHLARRAFVEVGKRLTNRGQIGDPEDVLFLTLDEVRALLGSTERPDLQSVVAERRASLVRSRTLTPPPTLGAPPPPQPEGRDRFWGGPPPPSTDRQIKGNAGSKGTVSGTARVAMTLAEATGIQPGEILVCPTTAPPWTPLFAVAAAVVTDTGGILSHCAVVAREYSIPAVVGTGVATQRIKTGQRIAVDGSTGIVTLE